MPTQLQQPRPKPNKTTADAPLSSVTRGLFRCDHCFKPKISINVAVSDGDGPQTTLCNSFNLLVNQITPEYFNQCAAGDPDEQRRFNAADLRDLTETLEERPKTFEPHHLNAIAALCNWLL